MLSIIKGVVQINKTDLIFDVRTYGRLAWLLFVLEGFTSFLSHEAGYLVTRRGARQPSHIAVVALY
jgi:hypothetical protein